VRSNSTIMQYIQNYINGEFCAPNRGLYLDNIAPATGSVYAYIPDSDATDVNIAIGAAQRAFPAWRALSASARSNILLRIAALIERDLEQLALAESIDNGKPVALARQMDIPRAAQNFQFFATAILHTASEAHPMGGDGINYTLREPLGVVSCISPWNLPLYLFTWKIAPALAIGNCVVAKPSEVTPMTAFLLSKICAEAGLPPGVLNIVHGTGTKTGGALCTHPAIKAVSFTGGTTTGAIIAAAAAPLFKKLSLELGGKNPNIIFADCDYNKMLDTTLRSSFANQGQICLCGSRILIERPLYERFRADFVERVRALRLGDPLLQETQIGAVVSLPHQDKILSYIELAQQEGGQILTGGRSVQLEGRCENGFFVEPTVIEGLSPDCRTNQEEIFGPVVTLTPFDTMQEAAAIANCTPYGLSATIWTNSLDRVNYLSQQLQTGILWVNCWLVRDLRTPFGGVKHSGVGREGGWEALRFFTEAKNVCIHYK
jgi:aminomuconate-semialdehyde/2-hydroxymuconate-6-semialdehyde dehydrogenase